MSDVVLDECMFCHEKLDVGDGPESEAFLDHVQEDENGCRDAFRAWRENMRDDFMGD